MKKEIFTYIFAENILTSAEHKKLLKLIQLSCFDGLYQTLNSLDDITEYQIFPKECLKILQNQSSIAEDDFKNAIELKEILIKINDYAELNNVNRIFVSKFF
jgi:hypothetical protein